MKKKKKVILGIIAILLLVLCLVVRYRNTDYKFKLYLDHAEIIEYMGQDKEVVIPERICGLKVTVLHSSAFEKNEMIESVKLPKYLEKIGASAFAECKNLVSMECGENLKRIGSFAFLDCSNLKNIYLNEGLVEIGIMAFEGATELESITIPKTVEKIGESAFYGTGLSEVTFVGEKTNIERFAFDETPWQEQQKGFVIYGDNVLIDYNGEETIIRIPEGVRYISTGFYNLEIKELYIPDTVIGIDDNNCLQKENIKVYIPSSVTDIEEGFYNNEHGGVIIVTTAGSYAEEFAKENGFNVEIVDEIVYPQEK